MNRSQATGSVTPAVALLCHLALWYGLLFATPLFIALHNRGDVVVALPHLAFWAGLGCLAISLAGWWIAGRLGPRAASVVAIACLGLALVLAIQGNLVHDRFYYGAFNGETVNFREYGWLFWAEWIGWLAAFPAVFWLLRRIARVPGWLPLLPLLSFTALLLPPLLAAGGNPEEQVTATEIDESVFAFSRVVNLVHLLPDGFQSDTVRQAFEEHPELAERFRGFTLFTDNVGLHHGTAPALYTLLTGEPFDLEQGFSYEKVIPLLNEKRYQNRLAEAGFQLDFVPISGFICPEDANSCHGRPFNDMKSRGLFRHRTEDAVYSVRLVADLTLFRLVPMYLKERIHNDGRWMLADTTLDGSSPWPDPVLREWTERMHIVDDRPVYKWYHYVGTHVPAKWDADCTLLEESGTERSDYVAQAYCVLNGVAGLLDRLEAEGIYDQTAMVISGDHGHNTPPDDLVSKPLNSHLYPWFMGAARPALLVKQRNNRAPLAFSTLPTRMEDVADTALSLAGIGTGGSSVFDLAPDAADPRPVRFYSIPDFYSGKPIPYVEYSVGQPARDGGAWSFSDFFHTEEVPAFYDPVNRPNAKGHVFGARLQKSIGNNKASWITGRQLAFEIALDGPARTRTLDLSLHFAEWIPEQRFRVDINGVPAWDGPRLAPIDEFWQTVSIPWPTELQQEGRNFVSVVFETLYSPPDIEDWEAPAFIQFIRVSEPSP